MDFCTTSDQRIHQKISQIKSTECRVKRTYSPADIIYFCTTYLTSSVKTASPLSVESGTPIHGFLYHQHFSQNRGVHLNSSAEISQVHLHMQQLPTLGGQVHHSTEYKHQAPNLCRYEVYSPIAVHIMCTKVYSVRRSSAYNVHQSSSSGNAVHQ